jgi:hypothetical protein
VGILFGLLMFVSYSSPTVTDILGKGVGYLIFASMLSLFIVPYVAVRFYRRQLVNWFAASITGAAALATTLFCLVLVTGLNSSGSQFGYYACTCCLGPLACIIAGWVFGSRLSRVYYYM